MKIAVVGGGSTYTPLLLDRVAKSFDTEVTFAIQDIDESRAALVAESRLWDHYPGVKVTSCRHVEQAAEYADLVILSYRHGGLQGRIGIDEISAGHGLLAQETHGFSGLISALLNIKDLRSIAARVLAAAPDAPVLVVTNPTGIVTAAAQALGMNALGICELPYGMARSTVDWLTERGVVAAGAAVDEEYLGTNHFGWLTAARVDGVDVLPDVLCEYASVAHVPSSIPSSVAAEATAYGLGALPNPYLGYLLGDVGPEHRAEQVSTIMRDVEMSIAAGTFETYERLMKKRGGYLLGDAVVHLVKAYLGLGQRERAIVVTRDPVLSARFGYDVAFEQSVDVDRGAVEPAAGGAVLHPVLEELLRIMACYEWHVVKAGLEGSYEAAEHALLINPFVSPRANALEALKVAMSQFSLF